MAKPRLLFYLKPEALEVYSDQTDGPARLDFPPEIIAHQEVLDQEKYPQILESFLSQMGINQLEGVILIAQPLIYSKEFPYQESTTAEDPNKPLLDYNVLNTKIQAFVEAAPFDNNSISKLELKGETSSLVLVTNKALYQPIADTAAKLGGRILSATPITVFGDLAQKPSLDRGDIDLVFDDRKNLQANNFFLSQNITTTPGAGKTVATNEDSDAEDEEEGSGKKSKILLIFGTLFILGGLLALAMMLGFIKNPFTKPAVVEVSSQLENQIASPSPNLSVIVATNSATASGSAALQEVKKENLKVGITNGSGVIGQGGKVQTQLAALGYQEITITGTELSGTPETTIKYSPKLTNVGKDELTQELGKTFLTVKATEATAGAEFDIEITTGVYK